MAGGTPQSWTGTTGLPRRGADGMTAEAAPWPILIGQLTLVDLLLLLAPVLIVPLGLRLVPLRGRWATRMLRLARLVQPAGAVAAVVAFMVPQGWTAGVIAAAP